MESPHGSSLRLKFIAMAAALTGLGGCAFTPPSHFNYQPDLGQVQRDNDAEIAAAQHDADRRIEAARTQANITAINTICSNAAKNPNLRRLCAVSLHAFYREHRFDTAIQTTPTMQAATQVYKTATRMECSLNDNHHFNCEAPKSVETTIKPTLLTVTSPLSAPVNTPVATNEATDIQGKTYSNKSIAQFLKHYKSIPAITVTNTTESINKEQPIPTLSEILAKELANTNIIESSNISVTFSLTNAQDVALSEAINKRLGLSYAPFWEKESTLINPSFVVSKEPEKTPLVTSKSKTPADHSGDTQPKTMPLVVAGGLFGILAASTSSFMRNRVSFAKNKILTREFATSAIIGFGTKYAVTYAATHIGAAFGAAALATTLPSVVTVLAPALLIGAVSGGLIKMARERTFSRAVFLKGAKMGAIGGMLGGTLHFLPMDWISDKVSNIAHTVHTHIVGADQANLTATAAATPVTPTEPVVPTTDTVTPTPSTADFNNPETSLPEPLSTQSDASLVSATPSESGTLPHQTVTSGPVAALTESPTATNVTPDAMDTHATVLPINDAVRVKAALMEAAQKVSPELKNQIEHWVKNPNLSDAKLVMAVSDTVEQLSSHGNKALAAQLNQLGLDFAQNTDHPVRTAFVNTLRNNSSYFKEWAASHKMAPT